MTIRRIRIMSNDENETALYLPLDTCFVRLPNKRLQQLVQLRHKHADELHALRASVQGSYDDQV